MPESSVSGITLLLRAWREGDDQALEKLTSLVYEDLDRLAHFYMAHERTGHILQDTALIDETFLRLAKLRVIEWKDRKHFYVVCAQLMQRILTDYARSELYQKRGGNADHVPLDECGLPAQERRTDLVALEEALNHLATIDERKAKVVQLRFFAGLSVEETAEVLDVSKRTVNEDWKFAKSWLLRELDRGDGYGK
jgi:RNA polymerase sigma-70 factor (ECF subfamily)